MNCPVCNNESKDNICPVCGYSLVNDLLNNRFLNKITREEIEEYKLQISIHRKLYQKSIQKPKEDTIKTNYTKEEKKKADDYFKTATHYYEQKDYENSRKYFELSAKHGRNLAYFYLGIIYRYGLGVSKDYQKAFDNYNMSAKLGTKIAYRVLGDMYLKGEGVTPSLEKGLEMYDIAMKNDKWAIYDLASKYYFGEGVLNIDYVKARELFEKDIKEGMGRDSSYLHLSEIYEKGLGTNINSVLSRKYYREYEKKKNKV